METIAELKKIKEALEVLINESEKPKFEVNKWYKGGEYLICPTDLTDPNNAKGYGLSSGIWKNFENFGMNGISKMTEATHSEVQEALEKHANVLYKDCKRVKPLLETPKESWVFTKQSISRIFQGCFFYKSICVMKDGIWATPINTKTIDEISRDLSVLSKDGIISYMSSTENKQTIIETLKNL